MRKDEGGWINPTGVKGDGIMKKLIGIIGLMVIGGILLVSGIAGADDACIISVSPPSSYGVTISTPAGGIDFGNVSLDTVYVYDGTATVTNTGEVVADWQIRGVDASTWSLTAYSAGDKDSIGENQMNMCVVFASMTYVGAPTDAEFDATDIVDATSRKVDNSEHSISAAGDGDDIGASASRMMFFRIHTPNGTTTTEEQDFKVYIEAMESNTF